MPIAWVGGVHLDYLDVCGLLEGAARREVGAFCLSSCRRAVRRLKARKEIMMGAGEVVEEDVELETEGLFPVPARKAEWIALVIWQ